MNNIAIKSMKDEIPSNMQLNKDIMKEVEQLLADKCIAKYTIEVNQELLNDYLKHYFKLHPRASKKPINSPIVPSLNDWTSLQRMSRNTYKQNWTDFMTYILKKQNIGELNILNCVMVYKFFFGTRTLQDNDNRTPKFANDPLTINNILVDDNYRHLNPLIIFSEYDKGNPHMNIEIYRLE